MLQKNLYRGLSARDNRWLVVFIVDNAFFVMFQMQFTLYTTFKFGFVSKLVVLDFKTRNLGHVDVPLFLCYITFSPIIMPVPFGVR